MTQENLLSFTDIGAATSCVDMVMPLAVLATSKTKSHWHITRETNMERSLMEQISVNLSVEDDDAMTTREGKNPIPEYVLTVGYFISLVPPLELRVKSKNI